MERPTILDAEIITETKFYRWLQSENRSGFTHNRFTDAVLKYFGKPKPFTDRTDLQAHKFVFEAFQRNVHNL